MRETETPGAKLRRIRAAAGLTQAQLAERAGVTQGRISQIEGDLYAQDLATLHSLAVALGHDPHDLDPRLASTRAG